MTDAGLSPRCGKGFFSERQHPLQTLLQCLYSRHVQSCASTSVHAFKISTLATIPLSGHTKILHTLIGMGRVTLAAAVQGNLKSCKGHRSTDFFILNLVYLLQLYIPSWYLCIPADSRIFCIPMRHKKFEGQHAFRYSFCPLLSNHVEFQISSENPLLLCQFQSAAGPAVSKSQCICVCVWACMFLSTWAQMRLVYTFVLQV